MISLDKDFINIEFLGEKSLLKKNYNMKAILSVLIFKRSLVLWAANVYDSK